MKVYCIGTRVEFGKHVLDLTDKFDRLGINYEMSINKGYLKTDEKEYINITEYKKLLGTRGIYEFLSNSYLLPDFKKIKDEVEMRQLK